MRLQDGRREKHLYRDEMEKRRKRRSRVCVAFAALTATWGDHIGRCSSCSSAAFDDRRHTSKANVRICSTTTKDLLITDDPSQRNT